MKKIFKIVIFLFLFNTSINANEIFKAYVVKVHDGDTIIIKTVNNTRIKIRLFGIDAPELQQEYGNNSKNYLLNLILNKTVNIEIKDKDQYGRSVALVYLDKLNVNYEMIINGYAWNYKKYSKDFNFENAEKIAKNKKVGLWKSISPIEPWIFRKNRL